MMHKPAFFLIPLLVLASFSVVADSAWNGIGAAYTTSWYPAPGGYAVQIAVRFTYDRDIYNPKDTWLVVKLYDENNTLVGQINKTFYDLFWPNEYGQVILGDTVSKTGTYRYHVVIIVSNKLYGELRLDFYPVVEVGKNNDSGWEPIYPQPNPQPEPVPTPREPIPNPATNTSTQEQLAMPSLSSSNKLLVAAIGIAVLVAAAAVVVARW